MTLESSIIATLTYSDHFSFPLTLSEIYTRLIKFRVKNIKILQTSLGELLKKGSIGHTGIYYYLPGRKLLISRRLEKQKISRGELIKARVLATKIARIPGVKAVYLTGSLAMSNSENSADIDFMIVTENKRLWTTRLILTLYAEILGLRRRPHSQRSEGQICLNLYLTPISFSLPKSKRTLYTAYELIQAVPLVDVEDSKTQLLLANKWIADYLPNFGFPPTSKLSKTKIIKNNQFLDYLENIIFKLQYLYMRGKITREYVTPNAAFFHPLDPGAKVLRKISY